MKKLFSILAIALIATAATAQIEKLPYKNLQVNKQVTFQNFTLNGCYIVIEDLTVVSFNTLQASVMISIYADKATSISNPTWKIYPSQIPYPMNIEIGTIFTEGNILDKISEAVKQAILAKNPTWTSGDIVIEQNQ